jgi:hypothetical protein
MGFAAPVPCDGCTDGGGRCRWGTPDCLKSRELPEPPPLVKGGRGAYNDCKLKGRDGLKRMRLTPQNP